MRLTSIPGGAAALDAAALPAGALGFAWLGQAGFFLRLGGHRALLDPYLSDHLARKYAGTALPHRRLMPPPVEAGFFRELDWIFCTHRHGDHMDPLALPILTRANPRCRFVAPRAEKAAALAAGLPEERSILVNAGESIELAPSASLEVLASAHERLQVNERGEHHFLGYVLRFGAASLYHSGDCVVYEGLAERLRDLKPGMALLPVNGRSQRLAEQKIAGNMNFDEAAELCLTAGVPWLVAHHFGMFDFNTADPVALKTSALRLNEGDRKLRCLVPDAGEYYLADFLS
jgi:L-ascorbate metabolism protein UlaG (beta-lactamase superfamily)